jgi:LysR family cyn operon transcriptional activator
MELRHLRYFLAAAEEAHFTRAAERLHVSQPTLSQQIRQLERELGSPLFDRIGRRVRLTSAGAVLREHARRALGEIDAAALAIAELNGLKRGRVTVGAVQTANAYLIPPVLGRFTSAHPGITVRVEELSAGEVEAGVASGRLDLGISFTPPSPGEVEAEPLFEEELILIVAEGHRLAGNRRLPMRELEGEPMVLLPPEFCTRRLVEDALAAARVRPTVVVEMNSIEGILAALRGGRGATVLPALALHGGQPGLVGVGLSEPTPRRGVGLLWRRGGYRPRAALAFAAAVADVVATPATPGA